MVTETLEVLENISMEDGGAEVVIDAVASLTDNPDMITPEAADTALNVLDAGGDTELSADSASSAVSSVASILASSDSSSKSNEVISSEEDTTNNAEQKQRQKALSEKIMNVANKILDAIPMDGAAFKLDTPLIKANKSPIDPNEDAEASAPDGTGLNLSRDVIQSLNSSRRILSEGQMSINVISFKINT